MVSRERTYHLKSVLRNFSFKTMLDQSTCIDTSLTHTFMAFLCYSLPEKHISFIHITLTSFIHITHMSFIHISTHTHCQENATPPPLPTHTHTHTNIVRKLTACQENARPPPPHTHTYTYTYTYRCTPYTHTHCQEIVCLSGKF